MNETNPRRASSSSRPSSTASPRDPTNLSRRELLAGAGAGAAALFLERSGLEAAAAPAGKRAPQG